MARDYTLAKYKELLEAMTGYTVVTVEQFLRGCHEPFIILRHDVDKYPVRAARMAQLEKTKNILATYYFRWINGFPGNQINDVKILDHEIGYHFENLSEFNGDKKKALADFEKKLVELRKIAAVTTVAMHGAPRSKINNADMVKNIDLSNYSLLGEPHSSPQFRDIIYITDTGRNWSSGEMSINDRLGQPLQEKIKGTDQLIKLLISKKYSKVMINVHPQRWSLTSKEWIAELIGQNVKNIGKKMLRRGKN